jgi:hypothetical protein
MVEVAVVGRSSGVCSGGSSICSSGSSSGGGNK